MGGPHDGLVCADPTHGPGLPGYGRTGGVVFRDNLAGLNFTTVPEVLIESGNMRNATDAALLTSAAFQRLEARALNRAIGQFLTGTA